MKLNIYVLRERKIDYDCNTYWDNVKSTIYWHEARELEDSSEDWLERDFDVMELEIPDDMVWEK